MLRKFILRRIEVRCVIVDYYIKAKKIKLTIKYHINVRKIHRKVCCNSSIHLSYNQIHHNMLTYMNIDSQNHHHYH
jgi:hypothetical protein